MLLIARVILVKVSVAALAAAAFSASVSAQEFLPPIIDRSSAVSGSTPAPAKQLQPMASRQLSLEERVQRMERLLDNQALVDMSLQLDTIQTDSEAMRGELENLSHEIEGIKQRQRDLYLDIDRRLRQIEVAGSKPGASTTSVTSAPGMAPSMPATPSSSPQLGAAAQVAVAASSSAGPAKERDAYQRAFNVLKEGQYDKAIGEFQSFLASYPAGEYTDNAQYWLGEANYVTRRFPEAEKEFQKVLKQFPDSTKAPDAMLKLGYTFYELGQWQTARSTLDEVVSRFPGSTVARLAENRLQKMRLEGR